MAPRKPKKSIEIAETVHKDRRSNIPTEELRDFVTADEATPKTMLYPRDPSLDPQLVWRGKDEQDSEPLAVPVVPIYIQEKVKPQAIIASLQKEARDEDIQRNFYSDFNGGPKDFADKVDFYKFEQNWTNRFILGDSLMIMTSLAEKEGLKGKVQTIYLDPPYGIKFGSNWQVSTRKRDVKDGKVEDASRQPEQVKAFRDTWELGIHSYLSYLRDRLVVARDLLTETGSVFVQIGDENLHLVRSLLDEVFGPENSVSFITIVKTSAQGDVLLPNVCDYVLWYAKDKNTVKYRPLWSEKITSDASASEYSRIELADGTRRSMTESEQSGQTDLPTGSRAYRQDNIVSQSPPGSFPVEFDGTTFRPITGFWKTNESGMKRLVSANRVERRGRMLSYVRFLDDFPVKPIPNFWPDVRFSSRAEDKTYIVQTAAKILMRCLLMTTDPGDLVLDPTCGSGTTAFVAEQWGRRWITCDTSRVALALARTRLMSARFPYYILADSLEGIRKDAELTGLVPPPQPITNDIKKGFVYKRVPHVTLRSIANNSEIAQAMTREEINAAIARNADSETLFDQPYEDNKKVRVSGPFSVESLSPHRVLSTADENMSGTVSEQEAQEQQDFATMILDNLRRSGVQNTIKQERLTFETLDPFAGHWLNATGSYTDAAGKTHTVAVSLGPEHGTVGPEQVKEAAKEAVQGLGFNTLVVCGFAFDPHVAEETKRFGNLQVLIARMNPDLSMGGDLLKKTGTGNLFMVFGEPDIELKEVNGDLLVTIKGVDVYDPTTGEVRSHSTDDIACWFIDTDYNGESFFVRHAYFTGKDQPYEKLKRALRAEIDESAWSSLYSTISRPFSKPAGKQPRIAIKVINHYGDEVLKVFPV
ncbi:site-specific DNA-methyltransferase [Tunturiibacter gelidoferens]|uniref:Adenine-specific DNA-methyltransferase n=1 Tax=Tunturiibacter gelidiferens TaxID=3069689 RepID=A0ACC5P3T0_9BACT|nr:site-specific DNA-methyltransferase [Edaphobacter lichenicola]MBB5341440.1 adenine-specific DNA-methyltransferase [Edaphobacter lichenicola]